MWHVAWGTHTADREEQKSIAGNALQHICIISDSSVATCNTATTHTCHHVAIYQCIHCEGCKINLTKKKRSNIKQKKNAALEVPSWNAAKYAIKNTYSLLTVSFISFFWDVKKILCYCSCSTLYYVVYVCVCMCKFWEYFGEEEGRVYIIIFFFDLVMLEDEETEVKIYLDLL